MKKYLFLLFTVATMVCTTAVFSSCSKDEDKGTIDNSQMVGSWSHEDQSFTSVTTTYTFNFSKDGSFVYTATEEYMDPSIPSTTEPVGSGTFSYNSTKNELTLNFTGVGTTKVSVGTLPCMNFTYDSKNFTKGPLTNAYI